MRHQMLCNRSVLVGVTTAAARPYFLRRSATRSPELVRGRNEGPRREPRMARASERLLHDHHFPFLRVWGIRDRGVYFSIPGEERAWVELVRVGVHRFVVEGETLWERLVLMNQYKFAVTIGLFPVS